MTLFTITASLLLSFSVLLCFRQRHSKAKVIRIITERCTACQRCLKICRHKALIRINDNSGCHIVSDPNHCTACGKCISACRFNALELADRKGKA